MFGPNCATTIRQPIDGHHREAAFGHLLADLDDLLRRKLGIGPSWTVLFLTGSGTLGIEAAIASLCVGVQPPAGPGRFTQRMRSTLDFYGRLEDASPHVSRVGLETSLSRVDRGMNALLFDAVSSYPYYDIPAGTKVWATVSSKQLGAAPVLALLGVHADAWPLLHGPGRATYLNLADYRERMREARTPFTPAIPLLMDLREKMLGFDRDTLRRRIDANSDLIAGSLGKENLVGERRCPVLTVPKSSIHPDVAARFRLYGAETDSDHYGIFTYSEEQGRYEDLCAAIDRQPARPLEAA